MSSQILLHKQLPSHMVLNNQHEWIRWPIFVDKNELVQIVSLRLTFLKCCEDPNNGKNSFNFNLINRDS